MITIGLTGGIGSGKSTVAGLLLAKGALLIDADQIARQVVEPGSPAHARVVERFGDGVVGAGGEIARDRLAKRVFADAEALSDLNAIVHPAVAAVIAERLAAEAGGEGVVVLEIPLLVESGGRERYPLDGVVVVDAPVEVSVRRLVSKRQMASGDARSRVAAQATRAERLAAADYVIVNAGSLEELEAQVDGAWEWMSRLRAPG
ncbi:MAG: dephospho-CoA kinase [Acidimicrobiales bacterium]